MPRTLIIKTLYYYKTFLKSIFKKGVKVEEIFSKVPNYWIRVVGGEGESLRFPLPMGEEIVGGKKNCAKLKSYCKRPSLQ